MADFYQTGVITTFHHLGTGNVAQLEQELVEDASVHPIGLVIPSLASEMDGQALPDIVQKLAQVPYLNKIVVALDRASPKDFARSREFFKVLPQPVKIVWLDGPRVQALFGQLEKQNIGPGPPGKGRGVWTAFGFILGDKTCRTIVLHDADILTYSKKMLARLCFPVANPTLPYEFAKGFYARVTDRLHGRVTRLFFTPLVRTLQKFIGYHPYLVYLDSFRYPLAGEFAIDTELARIVRIPGDWGLEIGILGEVYRNVAIRRICEVDIAETYDHKHQLLNIMDMEAGLMKMAIDIAKSLFRTLTQEGISISDGFFHSLRSAYLRMAQDQIARYDHDAAINGLQFDRHAEGIAAEAFAKAIQVAAAEVIEDPLGMPLISNWARVDSAIPGFLDDLYEAVESDNNA